MSNFAHQQPNFFEFPQQGMDFSQMMYAHHPNSYLSPPPQSPPFQLCELIYTPVSTPNGVQMTPSLVPISSMDGQGYGNRATSPVLPPQQNYTHAQMKMNGEEMERRAESANKGNAMVRSNSSLINGIPADQWKSMTDKEREDFLKVKRRQEAFKTALCQAYQRTGECRYGNDCRFAHGKDELSLPKYNHPKYKTILCRNYAVTGLCPYGSRCQFIHEKYQGAIPEEYIVSVETIQEAKPRKFNKMRALKNVEFGDDEKQKFVEFRGGEKIREAKKELQENNELNYLTDLSETFDTLFDAKKFFSRSCKPRIEV